MNMVDAQGELFQAAQRYRGFPSAAAAIVSVLAQRGAKLIKIVFDRRDGMRRIRFLGFGANLSADDRDSILQQRIADPTSTSVKHYHWIMAFAHHAAAISVMNLDQSVADNKPSCLFFETNAWRLAQMLASKPEERLLEWRPSVLRESEEFDELLQDLMDPWELCSCLEIRWNGLGLGQGVNAITHRNNRDLVKDIARYLSSDLLKMIEIIDGDESHQPRVKSLGPLPAKVRVWAAGQEEDLEVLIVPHGHGERSVGGADAVTCEDGVYRVTYYAQFYDYNTSDERANRYRLAHELALCLALYFGKDDDLYRFEDRLDDLLEQLYPK